jgi:hypothetical protein
MPPAPVAAPTPGAAGTFPPVKGKEMSPLAKKMIKFHKVIHVNDTVEKAIKHFQSIVDDTHSPDWAKKDAKEQLAKIKKDEKIVENPKAGKDAKAAAQHELNDIEHAAAGEKTDDKLDTSAEEY